MISSLQAKLLAAVSLVFSVAFGLFFLGVYFLPGNILSDSDVELGQLAENIVEDAAQRNRTELRDLRWPQNADTFYTNSTFYMVLDGNGRVVKQSPNMPRDVNRSLGADLDVTEPTYEFSPDDGTLRVLTVPLLGTFEGEQRTVGYLQLGRQIKDFGNLRRLTLSAVFIGLASLFGSMAIFTWYFPSLLDPLSEVTAFAEQVESADDLSIRFPVDAGGDEINQLVGGFNRLLERMDKLFQTQQRLLADVSHELRTPLTAIRGNVDLIRRMDEVDKQSLDDIESEAKRMSRLVDDLLSLARAEVGGLPIREEVVDLDNIFLTVFEQVTLLRGDVRMLLIDVQPARMIGDPDRLKQLLLNLMTNAVKYTNEGGRVTISLTTEGNMAEVIVADTGLGISAVDLPHIFDRFYRVNKARTRERGGAGLGLSIAKSIVDAHKGTISATSELGKGSTFIVRLPLLVRRN